MSRALRALAAVLLFLADGSVCMELAKKGFGGRVLGALRRRAPARSCADLKSYPLQSGDVVHHVHLPPFCLAGRKSMEHVMGFPGFLDRGGGTVEGVRGVHLTDKTFFSTLAGKVRPFSDWLDVVNGLQQEDDDEETTGKVSDPGSGYPFPLLEAVGEFLEYANTREGRKKFVMCCCPWCSEEKVEYHVCCRFF